MGSKPRPLGRLYCIELYSWYDIHKFSNRVEVEGSGNKFFS